MTQHILVRHRVENFEKWFKFFLEDETNRKENGVNHHNVFNVPGDEGDVVVHLMLEDPQKFQNFLNSNKVKEIKETAGVLDSPVFYQNIQNF